MKRSLLLLTAFVLLPAGTEAQSLFGTRGLGVPSEPIDARARALGGIGVGLLGTNPSLVNPAEIAGIGRRGVTAVLQPATHSAAVGDAEAETSASRFPLIGVLFPINPRLNLSLAYGGYLEQGWAVRSAGSASVDGQSITTEDVLRSTGAISQLRLTGAYRLTETVSIGAAGGVITGNLDRVATRNFVGDTTFSLRPFTAGARWEYSGFFGSLGARFDPHQNLRMGASVTLAGDIAADSVAGGAVARSYGGGLQLATGASARLTRDVMAAAGVIRQRYPQLEGSTDVGRDTWAVGGGIEYEGLRRGRRAFPLRVGGRWQQLPYHGSGETAANELAGSVGMGFRLAGDETAPLAVVDMGLERVQRTGFDSSALASGLEESLWRWTFSLALFGR